MGVHSEEENYIVSETVQAESSALAAESGGLSPPGAKDPAVLLASEYVCHYPGTLLDFWKSF